MGAMHAHFLDRHVRIPGFQIDPANRVAKHADGETASQPVERRRPHTVVRREATDVQFVHIELVQGRLEVPAAIGERLEGRIRILFRIHSLREDDRSPRHLQVRMESGAFRPLDAMRRPRAAKFLEVLRLPWMPVPREEDGQMAAFEERDGPVHPRDDCVPIRHTERPTRAEVVLNVDDEQSRLWSHGSGPRHPGDSLKGCGPDETLEIRDVVLPEREVRGQALKPSRLLHVGTSPRDRGGSARDELGEVAVPHTAAIGKGLLENAREDGLQRVQAHLLMHFAAQAVHGGLPFLQTATGGDPGVAPTGRGNMMDQENATPPVVEEPARGPERVFGRPKRRVVRWDDDFPFLDRNPSEPVERIREPVLANSRAHRPSQGWEAYLTPPRVSGPRTEGSRVPLEDVSDRANKVYDTMKSAGITSEDKMRDAEAITKMSKLPKNFVLQALQELQAKGYAKRRAREKAAGYWLIK